MVRREFREHVFKMLFQIEFIDMEDMPEHISLYLDYLESAGKAEKEQIKNKLQAVIGKVTEIDGILNKKTTGWKTTRMNKVDLTILRLATYEMKWDEDIPTGVAINEAVELAKRSRGTPRLANRLLKRVRDFAQVKYDGVITESVAHYALDMLDVDKYGLDRIDRNILFTMIEKFQGGPVGLDTLAATISEDAGTLEDVYEPYLLKTGFIQRTPRGRVVTQLAYGHLGIPFSEC